MVRLFSGATAVVREFCWLLIAGLVGYLFESSLALTGLLIHDEPLEGIGVVPLWLVLLWLSFATTFRFSFRYFLDKPIFSFVIGAAVSLSYWAGDALNEDVTLAVPIWQSLLCVSLAWAFLFPLLCTMYRKLFFNEY